jgi:hypothetical protein
MTNQHGRTLDSLEGELGRAQQAALSAQVRRLLPPEITDVFDCVLPYVGTIPIAPEISVCVRLCFTVCWHHFDRAQEAATASAHGLEVAAAERQAVGARVRERASELD